MLPHYHTNRLFSFLIKLATVTRYPHGRKYATVHITRFFFQIFWRSVDFTILLRIDIIVKLKTFVSVSGGQSHIRRDRVGYYPLTAHWCVRNEWTRATEKKALSLGTQHNTTQYLWYCSLTRITVLSYSFVPFLYRLLPAGMRYGYYSYTTEPLTR